MIWSLYCYTSIQFCFDCCYAVAEIDHLSIYSTEVWNLHLWHTDADIGGYKAKVRLWLTLSFDRYIIREVHLFYRLCYSIVGKYLVHPIHKDVKFHVPMLKENVFSSKEVFIFHHWNPARGSPSWLAQWCAIVADASRGTLSWRGTLLALLRMGMGGSVYGYHTSLRSFGPLWIWRLCSFSSSYSSFT